MIEELGRIYNDGGLLEGVDHVLFGGDSRSLTAIVLRFETLTAVLRAVAEDDTLAVTIGLFQPRPQEVIRAASLSKAWVNCLRRSISWAWQLTNQQGYTDGLRLEFGTPDAKQQPITVELIVVASDIQLFHATELR
jgi:hypothetical protein